MSGTDPSLSGEPGKKRKVSLMWQYFEQLSPNKVKCLMCAKTLVYSNSTSSMVRHFRCCHGEGNGDAVTRKEELDEALVSMIVQDAHPFSMVEDGGFREFVEKLDPTYVLPTKKDLKAMVDAFNSKIV